MREGGGGLCSTKHFEEKCRIVLSKYSKRKHSFDENDNLCLYLFRIYTKKDFELSSKSRDSTGSSKSKSSYPVPPVFSPDNDALKQVGTYGFYFSCGDHQESKWIRIRAIN